MGIRLGMEAKLYRNTGAYGTPTWVALDNVRDLTLSLETGEADVTTRANQGWRAIAATLKEGSIEFEMIWDTEDAGFTAIKDAYFNNTPIEMAVLDGKVTDSGVQGLRASFSITNFSRSEPLEEAITVSVTAKPTYSEHPPQWMKVP